MIVAGVLAAGLLAGDAWTWTVSISYTSPTEGLLLNDRERWTVRIKKAGVVEAERQFVGTVVEDGTLIPGSEPHPEILKGHVASDGTLTLDDSATDPSAATFLKALVHPPKETPGWRFLPGWPVALSAGWNQDDARLPGSGLPAALHMSATLVSAHLGGQTIDLERKAP